jgi:hypothetical protein
VDDLVRAEFAEARNEINMRTQLGLSIIALDLTALGTGLSLIADSPTIVVALAAVSAYLWSLWLDQASQVWKLAAYVALRLQRRAGPGTLQWEAFLRVLDEGGTLAQQLLRPGHQGEQPEVPRLRTRNIGFYISMLLGGTPVLLVASYLVSKPIADAHVAVWIAIVLAIVIWLNSLRLYGDFRALARAIDDAIRARLDDPPRAAGPDA